MHACVRACVPLTGVCMYMHRNMYTCILYLIYIVSRAYLDAYITTTIYTQVKGYMYIHMYVGLNGEDLTCTGLHGRRLPESNLSREFLIGKDTSSELTCALPNWHRRFNKHTYTFSK